YYTDLAHSTSPPDIYPLSLHDALPIFTNANHVVLYDRWWNPAVEDQARDRAWRIGQTKTVISHRLVCPGTVDERVEEVVAGKRQDRKSTRLNSSHVSISYAVFCLKKKT